MERVVLAHIQKDEIEKIKEIDRSVTTLTELRDLLKSNNDVVKEYAETYMYEQVEVDIKEMQKEKDDFFNEMHGKYKFEVSKEERVQIDFSSGCVYCFR